MSCASQSDLLMASTAIQMLSLSPCMKTTAKMMVFDMETGGVPDDPDTDTVEAIVGDSGKRKDCTSSEYGDDDQERGHVKKRRKQAKPVRIASTESMPEADGFSGTEKQNYTPDGDAVPIFMQFEHDIKAETVFPNEQCGIKAEPETPNRFGQFQSDEENAQDIDRETLYPINLSNVKSTNSFLDNFVKSQTPLVDDLQKPPLTAQDVSLPAVSATAVSTSVPYQEGVLEGVYKRGDPVFSTSPSLLKQQMSLSGSTAPARHTGSPIRIFNPEAFCDLCNKEFCNKYFLKTHKANKHGIYAENIGTNAMDALPPLPFSINYFTNTGELVNTAPPATTNSQAPPRPTALKKPILPALCHPNLANFTIRNTGNNGSMRAFCNVCQREFCNKYFVRRHKAKIHGIIDSLDNSDGPEQRYQLMNDLKTYSANRERAEDSENYQQNRTQPRPNSNSLPSISLQEIDNKDFCVSSEKPQQQLCTSFKQEKEPESERNTTPEAVPLSINALHSLFGSGQGDDPGKETDSSNEKAKKLGIVNAEAFCEICCKEYCNKYFLRTHKMKSHGIAMDPDRKDERYNFSENSSSYNNQNMPLNLIVYEQNSERTDKNYSDTENSEEFPCNKCGLTFKAPYILQMHISQIHSSEQSQNSFKENNPLTNNNEEKTFKQINANKSEVGIQNENQNHPKNIADDEKSFSFDDFQKIHSMIVKINSSTSSESVGLCEICNKDFSHSSNLETHIMKEHTNLLEELNSMGEEENSNSQMFLFGPKVECSICQKTFGNPTLLNQHNLEFHQGIDRQHNVKIGRENEDFLKLNQIPSSLYSQVENQTTPTSSFCEICKKELCNKYFMKTHMQRMHGISIENGTHIGGVVCDICNKELCSKYFLRVHKQNSHGIIEDVSGLEMYRNQSPITDPSLKPTEQTDLNNRYFSHFTEVCAICSRRFRSMKWLKAHLLNDHGEEGKEKWKEFQTQFELRQYPREKQKKPETNRTFNNNTTTTTTTNTTTTTTTNNNKNNISCSSNSSNSSSCSSSGAIATTNNACVMNNPFFNNGAFVQKSSNEMYLQPIEIPNNHHGSSDRNPKNNVFTSIFNGKNTNSKIYHCSYCSFTTSILAFLFVHERSHTGGGSNLLSDRTQNYRCQACSLYFETDESYEKHLLSHGGDPLEGLLKSQLDAGCSRKENLEAKDSEPKAATELSNLMTGGGKDARTLVREPESLAKCGNGQPQLKQDFIRSGVTGPECQQPGKGRTPEDQTGRECEIDDELNGAITQAKECLELIANKTDVPVSFSIPQSQNNIIMQPFVLEDSGEFILSNAKRPSAKKSFLSSIVFLPVRERLKSPVTASFRLTPT